MWDDRIGYILASDICLGIWVDGENDKHNDTKWKRGCGEERVVVKRGLW